ncbi:Rap1a/Tai family immunity protein [Marinobacterium jannaschii]|uniref:Rap1a/Tai family immunity protein n=1 Tax=Marinobacterium jannaschii TaxID=64970 RepID=UPI0012EB0CC6|nr:Rap1a/Tai family immunity protein [Marinobacterium jannaschii]
MKIISFLIMLFLTWLPAIGNAEVDGDQSIFPQQLTARNLLTYCASSSMTELGRTRQRYCWGFVSGVEEAIRLPLQLSVQSPKKTVCVPKGLSSRELAKEYISYAGRRDANLDRPAAQVVIEALSHAYPCRTKKSKRDV